MSERYARPALGRDEVRRACRKASVAALDYAGPWWNWKTPARTC